MAYCEEYIELISAAVDGALSPAEQEKLNAHLALCPECKALYEDLTALHAALSDLPPAEVPADLHDRIMAAVAAEKVVPFAPAEKKRSPVRWQRWLASAAVLAVVLMGTWSWKPWERNTAGDLPAAIGQSSAATGAMPEATMAAADREMIQEGPKDGPADTSAPSAAPAAPAQNAASTDAAEPVPAPEPSIADGGDAAKVSGTAAKDKALAPGEDPYEDTNGTEAVAPRMARIGGGEEAPALRSAPSPEAESGGEDGSLAPMLFSALLPQPAEAPAETAPETPEETAAPAVQSFMVTSMLTSNELTPNETADPVEMTAREALDRLLEEYPMPGCETWEYEDIEPGWQSPEWTTLYGQSWLEYSGSESYGDKTYHIFGEWAAPFDEAPESLGCSVSYAVLADSGEIFLSGN